MHIYRHGVHLRIHKQRENSSSVAYVAYMDVRSYISLAFLSDYNDHCRPKPTLQSHTTILNTVIGFDVLSDTNNLYRFIWFQVFLFNTNNLHTFIWFQVFLFNTNNLYRFIWFQVFLSNTNNLHTFTWFQVFLFNTNNLPRVI